MDKRTDKIRQYAEHFVKLELMRMRLDVFQNVSSANGVDFIVRSKSGNYFDISLHVLNLEKDRSIKIPKIEIGVKLRDKYFIALVLFMKEMEPVIYLIPVKVFEHPNHIFIDNEQSERFQHLSNWEIKVFTKAIPQLSEFALDYMVTKII